MSRRFAQDTTVPVGQTQSEVKARLKAAGADQIAIFESADKTAVAFSVKGSMFRITIPINPEVRDLPQEERRAWRLMALLIKSKLEAIKEGATTIEREFLADMLLYDGKTVSEHIGPELQLAHAEGRMPQQLLLGAPR